jgi:shikimate kinase/3-dehydroquinate synthase
MRTIVLSGFMATGKSTVGPRLAERLGMAFVDTDAEIEASAGAPVAKLWTQEGEAAFRQREAAIVEKLLTDNTKRVIAFGGGTVTNRHIRHLALDRALVVTLKARPETIVDRVVDLSARPNLAIGDPVQRATDLLAQRADAYAECHLTIDTDSIDPDGVVDALVQLEKRSPIAVPLGLRSYVIDVTNDEPTIVTDALTRLNPSSLVCVTDANVERARGAAFHALLSATGLPVTTVVLEPGERNKNIGAVQKIWDAALGEGLDRDAVVVAFGGGVVGDLAGFAASSLLRGIRVVQVPTTLLAMVDASVGGKTGFDHATGKNLIGAFHQPSAVVADLGHLVTLPARERTAGLAEIVKIALACDADLFAALEADFARLAAGDREALRHAVRAAVVTKVRIVRDDERESGQRALLNLGHTIGHALEAHGQYDKYLHGEAVAIGTMVELAVGAAMGITPPDIVPRVSALLKQLGLPVKVKRRELEESWPFVAADKKRQRSFLRLPVVTGIGSSRIEAFALAQVRDALLDWE